MVKKEEKEETIKEEEDLLKRHYSYCLKNLINIMPEKITLISKGLE
jgi:hypothetical protein